jgi:hypothetical protein
VRTLGSVVQAHYKLLHNVERLMNITENIEQPNSWSTFEPESCWLHITSGLVRDVLFSLSAHHSLLWGLVSFSAGPCGLFKWNPTNIQTSSVYFRGCRIEAKEFLCLIGMFQEFSPSAGTQVSASSVLYFTVTVYQLRYKYFCFIHSSVALQPLVGPWPLLQFRELSYTDGRTPWTSDAINIP